MKKNKVLLKIDELKPGMTIAEEVKFNNVILLKHQELLLRMQ